MASDPNQAIPTLTSVVDDDTEAAPNPEPPKEPVAQALDPAERENLIAELQTQLAASSFELTERLLTAAVREVEVALFEQVATRLRQELPEMIDSVLRSHLGEEDDDS